MSGGNFPVARGDEILRLEGLSKSYGSVVALKEITLSVGKGMFVALRGPSGAGKSTLLYLIAGLLSPDAGALWLGGISPLEMGASKLTNFRRKNIGMVFQDARLLPYLDIKGNILAGGGREDRAEQLIASLGLTGRENHVPGKLSAGEQQRVGLARALVHDPKLILADEPTGNLDDLSAESVVSGLREFVGNGGTVLVVTHDPRVLEKADQVMTLEGGKIVS